jgi:hypothetical protein
VREEKIGQPRMGVQELGISASIKKGKKHFSNLFECV